MEVVIITGLSGAGRSSALKVFEDMEYFCVDNLPPVMAASFVKMCGETTTIDRVAMVADTRGGVFFDKIYDAIDDIRAMGVPCRILFLDTADDILIRRFKEVRRPHPLDPISVANGISEERMKLERLRNMADNVLDSSRLTVKQFSEVVRELYSREPVGEIVPIFVSFGFKNGIPLDADIVLDVRFLPNPYYIGELREHNGTEPQVREYVFSTDAAQEFVQRIYDLLNFLMPRYAAEGKRQLVVGLGCTGGKHRSVAAACALYEMFISDGERAVIIHRDAKI